MSHFIKIFTFLAFFFISALSTNIAWANASSCALVFSQTESTVLINQTLSQILQEDPLGKIHNTVNPPNIKEQQQKFFSKYADIISRIQGLKDQSILNADSKENISLSAKALGVSEKVFLNYHQAALELKKNTNTEVDLLQIQNEGKLLLNYMLGEPIFSRKSIKPNGISLVLFSGPKCIWCDYVKPTFSLLSQFTPKDIKIFYSENKDFANGEGIHFFPLLVVYGPNGRLISQAYFSNSSLLWNRMNLLISSARLVQGDIVVNKNGDIFKQLGLNSKIELSDLK